MKSGIAIRSGLLVVVAAISVASFDVVHGKWAAVLMVTVVIGATMAINVLWRPEKELPLPLDPSVLVCAFLFQFFVAAPILLPVFSIKYPWVIGMRDMATTLLAFELMLVAFMLGYRMRVARSIAESLPDFSRPDGKLPGRWIETAILVLALAGCMWYFRYVGGVLARLEYAYGKLSRPAMFNMAFLGLITGTILMAWRIFSSPVRKRIDVVAFTMLLAFEIPFFGVVLGARKRMFFVFIALATVWLLTRKRRRVPWLRIAVASLFLLAFFAVWGALRSRPLMHMVRGEQDPRVVTMDVESGYLRGVASPFLTSCLVMQIFPEQESFKHGTTLLVTLLGFIPRAIWPDKPVGLGKELTRYTMGFHYDPASGQSVTPTILGDFYANLGWTGVIVGGLVLGILCRIVACYSLIGMRDGVQHTAARVLAPALFLAGLVEVRSDSARILAFYALTGIPMLVALMFFRLDYHQQQGWRRR